MTTGFGSLDVKVGFGSGPFAASPTMTSIVGDVIDITTARGRTSPLNPFAPLSATITLDNQSRAYDALNAAGPYYGNFNKRSPVVISVNDSTTTRRALATGFVLPRGWSTKYPYPLGATAQLMIGDLQFFFAPKLPLRTKAYAGDLPGIRFGRILDQLGIPAGLRNIDAGDTVLLGAAWNRPGIDELLLTADADGGVIYIDKDGLFTFDGRLATVTNTRMTTAQRTLSDSGGTDVPMTVLDYDFDEALCNDAEIARIGDTDPQIITDATSITNNGLNQISRSNQLMQDLPAAYARAELLVAAYKSPIFAPSLIEIDPLVDGNPALDAAALSELRDRAATTFHPPGGGSADSADVFIEQIMHRIVAQPTPSWRTQFRVSAAGRFGFTNSADYIILNTGPGLNTGKLAF